MKLVKITLLFLLQQQSFVFKENENIIDPAWKDIINDRNTIVKEISKN